MTGDWDLAEDCVQDALARALERWPTDGVPKNPAAWLTTTARRRALDVLRRRTVEQSKLRELMIMTDDGPAEPGAPTDPYGDDRLRLIFTCCHPALPLAGQVALTLRTVAGLSTREVARAFLVTEATMAQRLRRAKAKISHAGVPYRVPPPHRLSERTAGVRAVVYLIFNAGYDGGPAGPDDLGAEAVRLAMLLTRLLPDDEETDGLLALLLLQQSRRPARTDAAGDLVPMEEQDRRRWDADLAAAGLAALDRAGRHDEPVGGYRLQAEIAACHVLAPDAASTDWARVVALYDLLLQAHPSPVVRLNRAVAIAFRDGPAAGLALVDGLAAELGDYPLLPAVRADLLRRLGRTAEAGAAYRLASELARTELERRYLGRRLTELGQARPDC